MPLTPSPSTAPTPQPPPASPAQTPPAGGDAPTPEEQAQYDRFVGLAFDLVRNPKHQAVAGAIDRLLKAPNAKEGLATAAVTLAMKVYDAAAQAGTKLSPVVVQHGLIEIVEELGELARTRGIKALDEDDLSGAYIGALDLARVELTRRGAVDADDAKAEWAELENNPGLLAELQDRYGNENPETSHGPESQLTSIAGYNADAGQEIAPPSSPSREDYHFEQGPRKFQIQRCGADERDLLNYNEATVRPGLQKDIFQLEKEIAQANQLLDRASPATRPGLQARIQRQQGKRDELKKKLEAVNEGIAALTRVCRTTT